MKTEGRIEEEWILVREGRGGRGKEGVIIAKYDQSMYIS